MPVLHSLTPDVTTTQTLSCQQVALHSKNIAQVVTCTTTYISRPSERHPNWFASADDPCGWPTCGACAEGEEGLARVAMLLRQDPLAGRTFCACLLTNPSALRFTPGIMLRACRSPQPLAWNRQFLRSLVIGNCEYAPNKHHRCSSGKHESPEVCWQHTAFLWPGGRLLHMLQAVYVPFCQC